MIPGFKGTMSGYSCSADDLGPYKAILERHDIELKPSLVINNPSVKLVTDLTNAVVSDAEFKDNINKRLNALLRRSPGGGRDDEKSGDEGVAVVKGEVKITIKKVYRDTKDDAITWSSTSKITVNHTAQHGLLDFVDSFSDQDQYSGLRCVSLYGHGKEHLPIYSEKCNLDKQIKDKRENLRVAHESFIPEMQKELDELLDQKRNWADHIQRVRGDLEGVGLYDKYVAVYGEYSIPKGRNYVMLSGDFVDKDGYVTLLPPIKYFFINEQN